MRLSQLFFLFIAIFSLYIQHQPASQPPGLTKGTKPQYLKVFVAMHGNEVMFKTGEEEKRTVSQQTDVNVVKSIHAALSKQRERLGGTCHTFSA